MSVYVERNPLPGTNGEKIRRFCRDNDGYYISERQGDVITCRQLNADGYLVRDRRDGHVWYWTILGRDVLDRMEARREGVEIPSLITLVPKSVPMAAVSPKPEPSPKPERKVRRVIPRIPYAGQEDVDLEYSKIIDTEFVRRFVR